MPTTGTSIAGYSLQATEPRVVLATDQPLASGEEPPPIGWNVMPGVGAGVAGLDGTGVEDGPGVGTTAGPVSGMTGAARAACGTPSPPPLTANDSPARASTANDASGARLRRAAAEIDLWFVASELHAYDRDIDRWVLAPGD